MKYSKFCVCWYKMKCIVILLLFFTWNIFAYNTDDWQNFYYPNEDYLKELPTGVPRTFPIFVCIDPNVNARRTQLIKQGMDIWNKAYKDHVSYLITRGVLRESDLGENIPDYKLFRILSSMDGSGNCPTDAFLSRLNFRWRERYLFITETIFTDLSKANRKKVKGRYIPDLYMRFFDKEQRIEINKDANFYTGTASFKQGMLYFLTVMLHELGHAVGIGHHKDQSSPLMYATNRFIWNTIYLPTVKDIEILLSLHIDLE